MSDYNQVPMSHLPKTALQAIYHAVTGKTENITKTMRGNVLIKSQDFDDLYHFLQDQSGIHTCVVEPTVTVVVQDEVGRAITYSSWEKYKALSLPSKEITSEVSLRFEFLLQLPNTQHPQRCVVDVNLDSSLPVIASDRPRDLDGDLGFMVLFMGKWQTVKVSIDFVDFLIAKSFLALVEEWFVKLTPTPDNQVNRVIAKRYGLIRSLVNESPRLGAAAYLVAAAYFFDASDYSLQTLLISGSLLLVIWALFTVLSGHVSRRVLARVKRNIIPSVIILSRSDEVAFERVLADRNRPEFTLVGLVGMFLFSLLINVCSTWVISLLKL